MLSFSIFFIVLFLVPTFGSCCICSSQYRTSHVWGWDSQKILRHGVKILVSACGLWAPEKWYSSLKTTQCCSLLSLTSWSPLMYSENARIASPIEWKKIWKQECLHPTSSGRPVCSQRAVDFWELQLQQFRLTRYCLSAAMVWKRHHISIICCWWLSGPLLGSWHFEYILQLNSLTWHIFVPIFVVYFGFRLLSVIGSNTGLLSKFGK